MSKGLSVGQQAGGISISMEDSTPSPPSETRLTTKTQEWIFNSSKGRIYSPTDIAMEHDILYWTYHVKNLL
jgi:hypothetical protein